MQYNHKPYGPYEKHVKRPLDCILAICAMVVLSPVLAITALLVRIKLGSPVLFTQMRPGLIDSKTGKERIFKLYKFRTMTDEKDATGNLLPDEIRLTKFGKILRATSLDELPELANIAIGDMALVGPRPQLVRDMVFMSEEQRARHIVKPGLTGLAQVHGRNAITWDEKLDWDLKYIKKVSFFGDMKILFQTVAAVFKRRGITDGENATALDYGDALLASGIISKEEYNLLQVSALNILAEHERSR